LQETGISTFYKNLPSYQNSISAGRLGCNQELKNKCSDCSTVLIGIFAMKHFYAARKDKQCNIVQEYDTNETQLPGKKFITLFLIYRPSLFAGIFSPRTTYRNSHLDIYPYACGAFYAPSEWCGCRYCCCG